MRNPNSRFSWILDLFFEKIGLHPLQYLRSRAVISRSARIKRPSRLILGRSVTIQAFTIVHCGGQVWSGYEGFVHIGKGSVIGPSCVLYGAGGLHIGNYVHLGPGVKIITQAGVDDPKRLTMNPTLKFDKVEIGDGAWIGAGSVILHGTRLGKNVTVAPNAVVTGVFSDFTILAGNPARIIGHNQTEASEAINDR